MLMKSKNERDMIEEARALQTEIKTLFSFAKEAKIPLPDIATWEHNIYFAKFDKKYK